MNLTSNGSYCYKSRKALGVSYGYGVYYEDIIKDKNRPPSHILSHPERPEPHIPTFPDILVEKNLNFHPSVALGQLIHLHNHYPGMYINGKKWMYIGRDQRPYYFFAWKNETTSRHLRTLEKLGLIFRERFDNYYAFDNTKWIAINIEEIKKLSSFSKKEDQ